MKIIKLLIRWWVITPLMLFLGLAILSYTWRPLESPSVKEDRLRALCCLGLKQINLQLFQYAKNKGQGIYFPDRLETLIEAGYLQDKHILECGCLAEYHYFTGLRTDMPGNLVLLMEKQALHRVTWDDGTSENRGWVIFLDGTVRLGLRPGDEKIIYSLMEQAMSLANAQNTTELFQVLQNTKLVNDQAKAMALWRLRQLSSIGWTQQEWGTVMKYLGSRSAEVSRQAALLLWKNNRKDALFVALNSLNNDNYFVRRDTWQTLFPRGPKLGYLSPKIAVEWATAHWEE